MKFLTFVTLFLGLGLVGCTTLESTPSVYAIETAIAQTQQAMPSTPTEKPALIIANESLAKPTDQLLPSPTISLIATVIAKPKPIFDYARIYGIGHLDAGHLLITIEVPGEISGNYHAMVGQEVFDCEILPEYPDRLYCTGPTSEDGNFVQFKLIESRSNITVFQTELGIPPKPYTGQFVETKNDKSIDKAPDQATPTPTLPAYPYP
jgi:hypothetical protein